jgi:hypothetical protein
MVSHGYRRKFDSKFCGQSYPAYRDGPANQITEKLQCKEFIMSKTSILRREAGVVLKKVTLEIGQTILAEAYSVSTRRTPEVLQSGNLAQAVEEYEAELGRCRSLALHR